MRRDIETTRGTQRGRGSEMSSYQNIYNLSDRLNRFLDEWATPFENEGTGIPACDIEETSDHYLVCMDMPGIPRQNIQIEVNGNQLRVSGERETDTGREGRRGRYERSYGRMERTFTLPADVDPDQIEANYRDGVIELAIPKSERSRPRRVEVGEKEGFFGKYVDRAKEKMKEIGESFSGRKEGQTSEKSSESRKKGERAA